MTGLVAGVDVGGTFTDLVIFNPAQIEAHRNAPTPRLRTFRPDLSD